MIPADSCLLILTVGTGTAGRHSNLAQGLINTLRTLRPRAFWLVPSTSPDSIAVADLIRDELASTLPGTFALWAADAPYRCIARHDSLEDCRAAVREVIRCALRERCVGERLLVNPTSGTKQMSAGATLAALDEGIGEIVFTVGEREDGVVKTGTERIETFDASAYFAERDLVLARELYAAGSHLAATCVLEKHPAFERPAAAARSVHEWCRLNYAAAATAAARAHATSQAHLQALARVAESTAPSALLVADLLDGAGFAHRLGDPEWALSLGYKTLEAAIQHRAFEDLQLSPPYRSDALLAACPPAWLAAKIRNSANDDGIVRLGLRNLAELLRAGREPLATALLADRALLRLVDARNEVTHALRTITATDSQQMVERADHLFRRHLALPQIPARPDVLPI